MTHHIVCDEKDYIIVDKAALEFGEPAVQLVRHSEYGEIRTNHRALRMGDVIITQHAVPQQDGTRISISGMTTLEVIA